MSRTKNDKPKKGKGEQVQLTEIQVEKISKTIAAYAKASNGNAIITMLAGKLEVSKDLDEKRKWIVSVYAQCFQTLTVIGAARDNKMDMAQFEKELKLFIKQEEK